MNCILRFCTRKVLIVTMSILLSGPTTVLAHTDEPGPFERLFRALRHGSNEPHRKSTPQRTNRKQSKTEDAQADGSTAQVSGDGAILSKPPTDKNTRSTSRATANKGADLPYGTPVPGKQGFVTSPFSPNSGYIDVRGFSPGTPVKDPYTGKVFLTP